MKNAPAPDLLPLAPSESLTPEVKGSSLAPVVAQPSAMEPAAIGPIGTGAMAQLLTLAVEKGMSPESLEKLVDLNMRIMDRSAAAEFFDAMAELKRINPKPKKSTEAKKVKDGGNVRLYMYASFDDVAECLDPHLPALGLSYSFDESVTKEGILTATCKVRHRSGHMESSSFSCPVAKESFLPLTDAQRTNGTNTTAKRVALCGAFGLSPVDVDDDAAGNVPGDCIDPGQEGKLAELLEATGTDKTRFLRYYRAENLSCVLAKDYPDALASLAGKLNAKKAGKA